MILLDTHVVVWLISDFSRLSSPARQELADARKKGEGLAISCITLLELAMMAGKGRIDLDVPLEEFLAGLETRFVVLPITSRNCAKLLELPANYPRDPADRIIAATALAEGLTLVTADRNIIASRAVPTVW